MALDLDWDWPELPPETMPTGPLRVEIVGDDQAKPGK
jgi:hypothetical protein